ncbi:MAG: TolC family protein [Vicinamibacterales bacterium]
MSRVNSLGQNFNGGLRQTLPWFGSSYQVSFNNSRSSNNAVTTRINPSYNSSVRMTFDMPILAGFKVDQTRNRLKTLPLQRQVEELRLQTTIENTKNSVRTAYWALKSAVEAIEIQRRALALRSGRSTTRRCASRSARSRRSRPSSRKRRSPVPSSSCSPPRSPGATRIST